MLRFLFAFVIFSAGAGHATGQLTDAAADSLAQAALADWNVPGTAVVVVTRDRVLYLKGHGIRDINSKEPVSADTLFPLASCSKAFTTALVGMLSDDNKISWDKPVRTYLPDFHLADPLADAGVTLRDLASHRSGLGSFDALWYRSPLSQMELVNRVKFLPAGKPFRTAFQYQNILVTAVGLAAARAAEKPWDELVAERIFAPLQMTNSFAGPTRMVPPAKRATPHRMDSSGKLVAIPWYEEREANPAGSVVTSARDLAAWLQFQLGDGTFHGKRLISEDRLQELHTPHIVQRVEGLDAATHADTTMMNYALGWVVMDYRGQLLFAHTGVIDGFRAQVALAPRLGFAVAVLSNRAETRMNLALINNYLDRIMNVPPRDWTGYLLNVVSREAQALRLERETRNCRRDPSGKPARSHGDYVGRYENRAFGLVSVTRQGEALAWEWNAYKLPLRPYRENTFELNSLDLRDPLVEFVVRDDKIAAFRCFDVVFEKQH